MRKRILLVLGAVFLAGALFYLSGSLWSGSFSLPGVEEGKGQSAGTEWGDSQNVPEASSAGQEQHTGSDWKESQVLSLIHISALCGRLPAGIYGDAACASRYYRSVKHCV